MFDMDIGEMTSSQAPDKSEWRKEIRKKLALVFANANKTSKTLLRYLDEATYKSNESEISPSWKILHLALPCADDSFKIYCEGLAEDFESAKIDVRFHETMFKIYGQMLDPSENPYAHVPHGFDPERSTDRDLTRTLMLVPVAYLIPLSAIVKQLRFYETCKQRVPCEKLAKKVDIMLALTGVLVTGLFVKNLYRLSLRKISTRRCVKNIVDTSFATMAGTLGYKLGSNLKSMSNSNPFRRTVVGVIFGLISSQVMEILIERITQYLLNISNPSSVEVTQAHNFFSVSETDSVNAINFKFRELCLKHHTGKTKDILLVYKHFKVIKLARGKRI